MRGFPASAADGYFLYLYAIKNKAVKAIGKVFILIAILSFIPLFMQSQTISAFKAGKKWGFKQGETIIIEPQYDSVFGFDQTNQICLVGNINPLKRSVNSLTKQVRIEYDFNYINPKNKKLYFKSPMALDSSCNVNVNKQTASLYLNNRQTFVASISNKKIL
ncbi:MAG TPA: hypothetical protein VN026_14370, partial [Bacteroidia bacterium]|nr:hypothetical protein [Bacteroidia bacterium]